MSEGTVSVREFTRAVESFERELSEVKQIARETLAEGKKTNGRVSGLEADMREHKTKINILNHEVFRGGRKPVGVVSLRDVSIVIGTTGILWAIVKAFPVLLVAGQAAGRGTP